MVQRFRGKQGQAHAHTHTRSRTGHFSNLRGGRGEVGPGTLFTRIVSLFLLLVAVYCVDTHTLLLDLSYIYWPKLSTSELSLSFNSSLPSPRSLLPYYSPTAQPVVGSHHSSLYALPPPR